MMPCRVFVVTGSNKGIGKSIVKLLLQDKEEKIVYLTSRNEELGKNAVKDLEALGLKPRYHQLDITDRKSIESLRDTLVEKHGGLDVLVNNAGMAYKGASTTPFSEQAEVTVKVNFFGTLDVCEMLFPILKQNARVCHISSLVSEKAFPRISDVLQKRFKDENLTLDGLKALLSEFINAAKEENIEERGWPKSGYGMSKVGVSMMTILQQKYFDSHHAEKNVVVNCCCPGLVDTDMTGGKYAGALPADEGADTPMYLALLPADITKPKGCFLKLRKTYPYPPSRINH